LGKNLKKIKEKAFTENLRLFLPVNFAAGINKLEYGLVGGFCSLLIVVPLVHWRKPIWRCITRQNNQGNGREPLIHGDGGVDYAANNFIDSDNVPKSDFNNGKNLRMNNAGLC